MTSGPPRSTVLVSGGIDSSACVHFLQAQRVATTGLFIDYGQAAATFEAEAVARIMKHLDCPLETVTVRANVEFHTGEILGRNAFLLSTAVILAPSTPTTIAIGIHAGTAYFDCSEPFLSLISRLIADQSDGRVGRRSILCKLDEKPDFCLFSDDGYPGRADAQL